MSEYEQAEVTKKLAHIALVMADGYKVFHMRMLMEAWEKASLSGDSTAQEMMRVITIFDNICKHVETL